MKHEPANCKVDELKFWINDANEPDELIVTVHTPLGRPVEFYRLKEGHPLIGESHEKVIDFCKGRLLEKREFYGLLT